MMILHHLIILIFFVTARGLLYGHWDPRKSQLVREANCQNSASERENRNLKGVAQ